MPSLTSRIGHLTCVLCNRWIFRFGLTKSENSCWQSPDRNPESSLRFHELAPFRLMDIANRDIQGATFLKFGVLRQPEISGLLHVASTENEERGYVCGKRDERRA